MAAASFDHAGMSAEVGGGVCRARDSKLQCTFGSGRLRGPRSPCQVDVVPRGG